MCEWSSNGKRNNKRKDQRDPMEKSKRSRGRSELNGKDQTDLQERLEGTKGKITGN